MFRLGFWEIVLIAVIIFLLFGYKKLPDIARKIGEYIRQILDSFQGKKGD